MVRLASLAALLLAPMAALAAPTSPTTVLEERSTCGVEANVNYYTGGACDGTNLATIGWKNDWSSYNYQRSEARSFAITWADYWDVYCALYDDYNGQGNVIKTLEWNTGYRICSYVGLGGADVKSIRCWGNNC
ncbi:hypothetical protein FE257_011317 [Aspergillus nanangensis]|uniref:Uncharacterized protein n=1 Tax=Aspergillus nanangensis TaxID=2582783 RepID=A0AAD4CHF9_ASPNN|nr:hypothetical protein FE257_011317 [Aspergillus nanangensis]